jgi:radical SAM protein with 4Fe4S-binding SPASM domain
MSDDGFFIDPFGDVLPCNGMAEKASMGNLGDMDWDELWNSDRARAVRSQVKHCDRNCWMIAAPPRRCISASGCRPGGSSGTSCQEGATA